MKITAQTENQSKIYSKHYHSFTMTEMLITMGVLIILFAIIASSFGGMRDSLSITDTSYTLAQDIRFAQRSSLFLTRAPQERWIYGIGVDLGELETGNKYTLFKWCSPFNEYNSNGDLRMRSELPAYNPNNALSELINGKRNAAITTVYETSLDYCPKCSGVNCTSSEVLIPISGYGLTEIPLAIDIKIEEDIDLRSQGLIPRFILFESITGRAFFYSQNGTLLNYYEDSNGLYIGQNSSTPAKDMKISLSVSGNQERIIEIKAVSGVVKINNADE
jgi:type II secretory pathway pseudopilin PulG